MKPLPEAVQKELDEIGARGKGSKIYIEDLVRIARFAAQVAAKICYDAPVDKARCRVLMLPEQAWQEGQEQCYGAIRDAFGLEESK